MYGGGMVGGGMGGGGIFGGRGGPLAGMHMQGALLRATDLTDDAVFGKVYDHKVVTRLAGYLKKYKVGLAISFVAMVIATLTSLYMPLLLSDALNVATKGSTTHINFIAKFFIQLFNVQGTLNTVIAIFLIFIVNGLLNWGFSATAHRAVEGVVADSFLNLLIEDKLADVLISRPHLHADYGQVFSLLSG